MSLYNRDKKEYSVQMSANNQQIEWRSRDGHILEHTKRLNRWENQMAGIEITINLSIKNGHGDINYQYNETVFIFGLVHLWIGPMVK